MLSRSRPDARGGFTLVECAVVCAIAGILAALAVPAFQGHQRRMARIDAVAALTRVQVEQEKHRDLHGLYAVHISALRGVGATSPQGYYRLALSSAGGESYRATATASGAQAQDAACLALTLDVASGFAAQGPSTACWNR